MRSRSGLQLRQLENGRGLFSYEFALVHLAMGEGEAALEGLGRARQQRSGWLAYRNVDPRLDPLRDLSAFREMWVGS